MVFQNQNTTLFIWLLDHEDSFTLTTYTIETALRCKSKSLYMIHWLWKRKCPINWIDLVSHAIENYWLELLQWAHQRIPAGYKNQFWEWENFPSVNMDDVSDAEIQNVIKTLKWAETHGCPINNLRHTFY